MNPGAACGQSDTGTWLGLVRAELHWREGDAGRDHQPVPRRCWPGSKASSQTGGMGCSRSSSPGWRWPSWRTAMRLAAAHCSLTRCQTAAHWVERPALADVIDAIAVLVRQDSGSGDDRGQPDPVECVRRAKLAATLLGAAHSIRGCFDEGSLDAPAARDAVRARLGADGFEAAYERGRALGRDDALALRGRRRRQYRHGQASRVLAGEQQSRRPGLVVTDLDVRRHQARGGGQGLPGAGIARETRERAAADLQAGAGARVRTGRRRNSSATVTASSARTPGARRRMPSVTFYDRPWGSTSQSRAKTCARPVLARTWSTARTGPSTSSGARSGSLGEDQHIGQAFDRAGCPAGPAFGDSS